MLNIAVNNVVGDNTTNTACPCVIALDGQWVTDVHVLVYEEPFTIWVGGTAVVRREDDGRLALYIDGMRMNEGGMSMRFA